MSEYTCPEKGAVDHCIRVDDLTFVLRNSEAVVGSGLIGAGFGGVTEGCKRIQDILENQVFPLSCKGKTKTKAKLIRRRSVEEGMFLEDVVIFVTRALSQGCDELFSYRKPDGCKVALRGRAVREELDLACALDGLQLDLFSSHSLRKGAVTHMRATGATE